MNSEKISDRINNISNRGRLMLGLCIIAAGLLFGVLSFDLTGGQPDQKETQKQSPTATETETEEEAKARQAHEKFFDTSDFKKQLEGR